MKRIIYLKNCIVLLLLCLSPAYGSAQVPVRGQVIDAESGEALIGANITSRDLPHGGVTSDADGRFVLELGSLPVNIEVSYIGYQSVNVRISDATVPLTVRLSESSNVVDEVVVVGYGTQKRENLTTSVSSVAREAIADIPVQSFESALQGRASGISLTTPSGNVGTAPIVRIRGVASITSGTSPLYVIDGVPAISGNQSYSGDVNALADINPADIVRIDILKDASAAALYGSRAANGVVLITTQKGQTGRLTVNYQGYVGVSEVVKFYDVMNAEQYVEYKNLSVLNRYGTDRMSLTPGYVSPYGDRAFNLMYRADGSVVDTDWCDYILQTGVTHSHSVSAGGGTDRFQYYMSGSYYDQSGTYIGEHYDRLQVTANTQVKATGWLTLSGKFSTTEANQRTSDRARQGNYFSRAGFTRIATSLHPNFPMYFDDGTPWQEDGHSGKGPNTAINGLDNPVAIIESGSGVKTNSQRFMYNFAVDIKPVEGMTFRSQYGNDVMKMEDRSFYSPIVDGGCTTNGSAVNVFTRINQYTWTNTLDYKWTLGESHNFDVLVGTEVFEKRFKRWGAQRTDLVDDSYAIFEAGYNNIYPITGAVRESGMLSYLMRINYDYRSRYIVSLNARRDGYSALSRNHRWGNFGGVSAAWRISEEPFFEPVKSVVTDMKLKAGWGVVGNTDVGEYAASSYYSNAYYGSSGAYTIGQIADSENLKWETSKKLDVGLNFTLADRVDVELGYYRTYSSDLILSVPVAPSKGIPGNSITTNAGAMRNSGIELAVSADILERGKFRWSTSFDLTTNKNVVTSLGNASSLLDASAATTTNITVVGKSIGQLYLYEAGGVDPETGRRILYGKDGTEVLIMFEKTGMFFTRDGTPYSSADLNKVICGNTIPTWFGGWTNNFSYGSFDLSVHMQFSGGNKIFNGMKGTLADGRFWNNSKDVYYDHWTEENRYAKYAKPIYGDTYSNSSSELPLSTWVENGDYLRMKNVVLGYTVTDRAAWLKKIGISKLRVYLQAQNLFVITGYSGLDPEVTSNTNTYNLSGGTDYNTAPPVRTFTLGLNITF